MNRSERSATPDFASAVNGAEIGVLVRGVYWQAYGESGTVVFATNELNSFATNELNSEAGPEEIPPAGGCGSPPNSNCRLTRRTGSSAHSGVAVYVDDGN